MRFQVKSPALVFIILGLVVFGAYWLILTLSHHNPFLNFGKVEEGRLYRSGLLKPADFQKLVKRYGIKTIICLMGKESPEIKELAQRSGVNLVGVQLRANRPPSPEKLKFLMKILREESFSVKEYSWLIEDWYWAEPKDEIVKLQGPFLIHCQMGADRTGYLVAIYRICVQGWSSETARLEMLRYHHFPGRHSKLWRELKKVGLNQLCFELNPDYQPAGSSGT